MTLEHFRCHADRLAQGRVWMNRFADVRWLASHFDREADFANEIACMGTNNAASDNAMSRLIEQQLRETLVASIRDCTA